MALIELTPDDLCAMVSSPFPCEEGTIIDPIAVAHFLGFVETTARAFEDTSSGDAASGNASGATGFEPKSAADPRLVLLSFACSLEANEAVTRSRASSPDVEQAGSVKDSLAAFTDGVIASPPVLNTVIPAPGTVVVFGTIVVTIPTPAPVPPHWEDGEQLTRTDLLAMAARFQSASKMPGIGTTADDLAAAATRLINAAMTR